MSSAAEQRAAELSRETREKHSFLDRRIPELQSMGKPHPGPSPDTATVEERMRRVVANAGRSKFPGRIAREVAEAEYEDGAR